MPSALLAIINELIINFNFIISTQIIIQDTFSVLKFAIDSWAQEFQTIDDSSNALEVWLEFHLWKQLSTSSSSMMLIVLIVKIHTMLKI